MCCIELSTLIDEGRHATFTKWGEPAVPFLLIRRYSLSIGVCAPPTTSAGGAKRQ